jgi:acetyl esterase/lipase
MTTGLPRHVRLLILASLTAMSVACSQRPERVRAAPSGAASIPTSGDSALLSPAAFASIPSRPADHRIGYGPDSSEFGDLRVPTGTGPHPVVVLIHGGCFKAAYATLNDLAPMADALKADGIASWNVEYRRVGQPGGGWPGTYLDIGRAMDHLRTISPTHALDLSRVVVVGHSAGGHLAMWSAARSRLPRSSALYVADPLPVRGAVDLAGPVDMSSNIAGYEKLCRDSVITTMLGGTPASVPDRYAEASAMRLIPLGVPQVLVVGTHEEFVPRPLVDAYVKAATQAGDSVRLLVMPRVGHFEIATTRPPTWAPLEAAIRALLDGRLPPR